MLGQEDGFKKSTFYSAMAGNKEDAINKQLDLLSTSTISEKEAYEGALLMKKAGLAGGAKKKLDLFKQATKSWKPFCKKTVPMWSIVFSG